MDLTANRLADGLLAWYDQERRTLPWRVAAGERADPYRVWVSEIMLQQTTVATVTPYYLAFLERWPKVEDLARASLDAVLHAWQGLGYYARARNLHACAQQIVTQFDGRFPEDVERLKVLPGVGEYTAAAIAAIAFDQRVAPVDGNVMRVMARLHAEEGELPGVRPRLAARAAALVPERRAGDFAQAMMDLGATVCAPRKPRCETCPWHHACRAHAEGNAESFPRRGLKPPKPQRHGVVFWVRRRDGGVLMQRRPARGLLGGLMGFPTTPFRDTEWSFEDALTHAPDGNGWQRATRSVEHTFTHFHLRLSVVAGWSENDVSLSMDRDGPMDRNEIVPVWRTPAQFADEALPTLMRKVVKAMADTELFDVGTTGINRATRRTPPEM